MKRLAFVLALMLLLCACAKTPPPATTAPPLAPETTVPTETAPVLFCPEETMNLPETTTPLSEKLDLFSRWYGIFEESYYRTWYRDCLGCIFTSPEEIDLNHLFYNGFGIGSWDLISAESEQYLIEQGFWQEMDLQPMPTAELEKALQMTFGISLGDVTIPAEWAYLEKEDFYCSNHNDAYMVDDFIITDVIEHTDGTVEIHYFCENYYNTATDDFLYTVDLIMTLKETAGESYELLVLSNVLANQNEYDTLYDRELIDIISTEEALANWATSDDPGSAEALADLAAHCPSFAELMTRSSALDTFAWYGPERIAALKSDPETTQNAEHLALLIASVRAP